MTHTLCIRSLCLSCLVPSELELKHLIIVIRVCIHSYHKDCARQVYFTSWSNLNANAYSSYHVFLRSSIQTRTWVHAYCTHLIVFNITTAPSYCTVGLYSSTLNYTVLYACNDCNCMWLYVIAQRWSVAWLNGRLLMTWSSVHIRSSYVLYCTLIQYCAVHILNLTVTQYTSIWTIKIQNSS